MSHGGDDKFRLSRGATVSLGYDLHPSGKKFRPAPIEAKVTRYGTDDCVMAKRLKQSGNGKISFKAKESGFYMLEVLPGRAQSFTLTESDAPVAFLHDGSMLSLLAPSGKLSFYVPAKKRFSVLVRGSRVGRVHAVLSSPSGEAVWDKNDISSLDRYQDSVPDCGGFWTIELGKPAKGALSGAGIGLTGVPGVLFLSDDKRWISEM